MRVQSSLDPHPQRGDQCRNSDRADPYRERFPLLPSLLAWGWPPSRVRGHSAPEQTFLGTRDVMTWFMLAGRTGKHGSLPQSWERKEE